MRKIFLNIILISLTGSLYSQWLWDVGVNTGMSNYLGDIGGKDKTARNFLSDMQLSQTRWNAGGFVRYKYRAKTYLRASVEYVRVQGDDKLTANPARHFRNFNFKNDLVDLGLTAEMVFYENNDLGNTYRYRNSLKMYVLGGVGGVYTNPKTYYQGQWVSIKDYQDAFGFQMKSFVMTIPMGAGAYVTLNKKNRFGVEINYRKTFSKYLDGVSGNYPDTPPPDAYTQGLVLRTKELSKSENPEVYDSHTWGAKRGGNRTDAYMTINFSYSRVIRGKSSFYRVRNGSGFFSKKHKVRKVRAKF